MIDKPEGRENDFVEEVERRSPNVLRDAWDLVRENKKWWLLPIIASLVLVGLIAVLSGTGIAPLIYTLF